MNQSNENIQQNNTFYKRKYTKNKKIIGEKDGGVSQNRIMISTGGSCQGKRIRHANNYNTNDNPKSTDRKSLKSAQPIRKAYQENLKRRMTNNNANNQTSLETRIEQQLKNDIKNKGVSVEIRSRRNKNLNIKRKIIESKNSECYNTNDINIKRKMLEKDVKNIKIVDYFSQSRKLIQNQNFQANEDHNPNTQNSLVLYSDNLTQNNALYHEGSELKNSLIDVSKAYELMNKMQDTRDKNRKEFSNIKSNTNKVKEKVEPNGDSIDLVPSNFYQNTSSQGHKWSKILEYMKRNPKVLMDAIPSPRPEEKLK